MDIIYKLAEHSAWETCRRYLSAGRSVATVRRDAERIIEREESRGHTLTAAGHRDGLRHALSDYARETGADTTLRFEQLPMRGVR